MKNETILRNNRIIVSFMGLKTYKHYEQTLFEDEQPQQWNVDITGWDIVAAKFHTSWDWLMPVYKQVAISLKTLEDIAKKSTKHFDNKPLFLKRIDDIDSAIRCEIWGVRIEDAYKGIVSAICFYEMYKNMDKEEPPALTNDYF